MTGKEIMYKCNCILYLTFNIQGNYKTTTFKKTVELPFAPFKGLVLSKFVAKSSWEPESIIYDTDTGEFTFIGDFKMVSRQVTQEKALSIEDDLITNGWVKTEYEV